MFANFSIESLVDRVRFRTIEECWKICWSSFALFSAVLLLLTSKKVKFILFINKNYNQLKFSFINLILFLTLLIFVLDIIASGMYYYNIETGQPLCGEVVPIEKNNLQKIVFRNMPCSCSNLSCSCCAGINLSNFNFNRRLCSKMTYIPNDFAIDMEFTMNDQTIFNRKISGNILNIYY